MIKKTYNESTNVDPTQAAWDPVLNRQGSTNAGAPTISDMKYRSGNGNRGFTGDDISYRPDGTFADDAANIAKMKIVADTATKFVNPGGETDSNADTTGTPT